MRRTKDTRFASTPIAVLAISCVVAMSAPELSSQSGPIPEAKKKEDEPATKKDVRDILRESLPFEIGAGIFLWHYQPTAPGAKPNTEIYWAYLTLDADLTGDVDFHLQTMFRDKPLRPFFTSNVWVQEGYLSWKPQDAKYGQVKVGKVYSQLGRFWDGSFYGNAPYFDGLKLDPDLGVSYEHNVGLGEKVSMDVSLQFFTRDGSTNGSLQGRDTLSFPGAVQRESIVGRAVPKFSLTENTDLSIGVSAQTFRADFSDTSGLMDDRVARFNIESALTVGGFEVFSEVTWQRGAHAPGYPRAGIVEDEIFYTMSGLSWQATDWLKLGYNFSSADYNDSNVREIFHMPRVEFQISESTGIWLEYVHWQQVMSGPDVDLDESFNLVLSCHF